MVSEGELCLRAGVFKELFYTSREDGASVRNAHLVDSDVYFKKLLTFRYRRQELHFRVSQDLFSSHQVDIGTQFLLRTISELGAGPFLNILDLGCGYGPIGLTLKKLDDSSCVHMVDRDALAVAYSRQNAELNGLSCVKVYSSLGYDDVVPQNFDLIVSNIPAKAGKRVIQYFLHDAAHHLRPGGLVAIVVVAPLEEAVDEILGTLGVRLLLKRNRRGHVAFAYDYSDEGRRETPPEKDSVRRGVYHHNNLHLSLGGEECEMQVTRNLPEFDSPSFRTELLIDFFRNRTRSQIDSVTVLNPGQGYCAVALAKTLNPRKIFLVDRDLLSLRYSQMNLVANGYTQCAVNLGHQVGMARISEAATDLVAGVIREDEGPEAIALTVQQAAVGLQRHGSLVLSASSTGITRILKMLEPLRLFELIARKRWKGNSLLFLQRR